MIKKFIIGKTEVVILILLGLMFSVFSYLLFSAKVNLLQAPAMVLGRRIGYVANVLFFITAVWVFILFYKIQQSQTWKKQYARIIQYIVVLCMAGFYIRALSIETQNLYRIYRNTSTASAILQESSIYIKAAMNCVLNPINLLLLLVLVFLSRFLNYTYFIKKENESII